MVGKVEVTGIAGACPVSRVTMEAKVIRANGTIEDHGVIADSGYLVRPALLPSLFQRLKEMLKWTH